jgi:hypothetical protein
MSSRPAPHPQCRAGSRLAVDAVGIGVANKLNAIERAIDSQASQRCRAVARYQEKRPSTGELRRRWRQVVYPSRAENLSA